MILKPAKQKTIHMELILYALCGLFATAIDILVFYALAIRIFPSVTESDMVVRLLGYDVAPVTTAIRARYFAINNTISFIASNGFAYVGNILWVFPSNSNKRVREIVLFLIFSILGAGIGTGIGMLLIQYLQMQTSLAFIFKLVFIVAFNYLARRYVVFR